MLLLATCVLELLLYAPVIWRFRVIGLVLLTAAISSLATTLLIQSPGILSGLTAIIAFGRLFNLLRIAEHRMSEKHLYSRTKRSSFVLVCAQVIVLVFGLTPFTQPNLYLNLYLLAAVQLVAAIMLFSITAWNISKTRYRQGTRFFADKELPTVSVLVPARNETSDLEDCLRTILASDYPKLEIIVLDDCSQTKISDVIKKFAHDGVRFIKGSEPHTKWLAKNQAYERLRSEASGELLLFCGVDVRLGTHAIRALVTEMQARDKQMISVLPHRLTGDPLSAILQPMRCWWELALPRKLLNKPAVLSTCWLIRAQTLKDFGGFAAVSRSVIPERFLARACTVDNNYSFIRADAVLGISTQKSFQDQQATAVRVKYPQLNKRPEMVLALAVTQSVLLLGPFLALLVGLIQQNSSLIGLSALAVVLLISTHITIVYTTNPPNSIFAVVNFPLAVMIEIITTLSSMYKYEFGEVIWKDRNVCIPVMHVAPHLPKV